MKKLIFLYLIVMTHSAKAWDLNDVTYLFPLPKNIADQSYIKARDNEILPKALFNEKFKLSNSMPLSITRDGERVDSSIQNEVTQYLKLWQQEYESLTLIALRIDPCFKDRFFDQCRRQIRVVWQPVQYDYDYKVTLARDAAIHAFYEFNSNEFDQILNSLAQLKKDTQCNTNHRALGIHPCLKSDSKSKVFKTKFKKLISTWITSAHMKRIAFFSVFDEGVNWQFKSFDKVEDNFQALQIPLVNLVVQNVHNGFDDHATTNDLHFMAESGKTNIDQLFDFNTADENMMTSQKLNHFIRVVRKVESPIGHLPGTIDCLSCHMTSAVNFIALKYGAYDLGKLVNFKGKYNLKNISQNQPYKSGESMRMLGYFKTSAQIANRVILESATVADQLNLSP